jgi:hypothetical protein
MKLISIQVEYYAGAKADETPRRFSWEGTPTPIEISEVLDRWYQVESKPEWPRADYFKVLGADQCEYLLKHDLESDEWFLGQRW